MATKTDSARPAPTAYAYVSHFELAGWGEGLGPIRTARTMATKTDSARPALTAYAYVSHFELAGWDSSVATSTPSTAEGTALSAYASISFSSGATAFDCPSQHCVR
ncbi:hypothetical protein BDV93DRAFT_564263 [Ceratobasidium sp. AG-I]|nr:hypothetical protein BDV93DRAFT_564263 [Ceratobasidium sp. AG-I]